MECKYCSILPDDDIPFGRKELLNMDFTDELEGESSFTNKDLCGYESITGTFKFSTRHKLNAHVCITKGNLLNLDVYDVDNDIDGHYTDIRIKYCPMCGRKLQAFYDD